MRGSDNGDGVTCIHAGSLLKANKSDVGIPIEFQLELTNNSGQLIISHLHKNNIVMACMYMHTR